jgi:hypothetical protein
LGTGRMWRQHAHRTEVVGQGDRWNTEAAPTTGIANRNRSDVGAVAGVTGMSILRAILAGERDCLKLAQLRHPKSKAAH